MEFILDFGVRLIAALQGLGEWQILPMKFFSFLGTEEFYMLVLPVLFWCVDSQLGIRVAVILLFSGCVNDAFKLALHGPRPYWYSTQVQGFASETSFGVPSGHSQNAVAVWGIIAAYLKKKGAWLAAILIMLMISVSRLSLGVHFPHDVLLGWLLGGLLLFLTVRFWQPVAAWAKKKSDGQQILIAFLTSLVMIAIVLLPFIWLKTTGWQAPQSWASFAADAISLDGILTNTGTFFGLIVGLIWLARRGGFMMAAPWWKLVLRYLLGLAGVLIIQYGLKIVFPEGETLLAYSLRYIRYALTGFWLTGGAPFFFVKLKLTEFHKNTR